MKATYISHMGDDSLVVDAARVSFARKAAEFTPAQNDKLIRYLARHGHWTPFGHPQITIHIEAPIFVARQLVKHQVGLVWNEVSRRYIDSPPTFFTPRSWRPRAANNKQGSVRDDQIGDMRAAYSVYQDTVRVLVDAYDDLLALGVAPEQARMILPLSSMTEWYWTGSLAAWARVYRLRSGEDAQAETSEIAEDIGDILRELYPVSWAALTGEADAS